MIDWSENWFGVWRTDDGKYPQLPVMEDFLDPKWDPELRSKAAKYLNHAVAVLAIASPHPKCWLCDQRLQPAWRSDGVWLWPDSLGHEVEAHGVRVPKRFEAHMASNSFIPPQELPDYNVQDLSWPKL